MDWLVPSIIGALTAALLIGLIYCYIYLQDRKRFLLLWGASWLLYATRFMFQLAMVLGLKTPMIAISAQLCSIAGGLLFIIGAYLFANRKLPAIWLYGLGFCALWSIALDPFGSFVLYNAPTDLFLGGLYIWVGVLLLRHEKTRGVGLYVASWSLMFWGLHKADYFLLRPVLWFAPWGFLAAAILFLSTSVGILLLYYERIRAELSEQVGFRRQAEKDIEKNQIRFKAIFEQAGVGIAITSLEGSFQMVNQHFCEFLGYSKKEMIGKNISAISHPDGLEVDKQQLEKLAKGEIGLHTRAKRYIRKDGALVWGNVSVSLVKDAKGWPDYFIGVVEDITERLALEKQLRQAQKMEAIGTLAGGIAHDFNNILGVVLGYSELVKTSGQLLEKEAGYLDQIVLAAGRARSLVKQILTFSRKKEYEFAPTDLNKSVLQAKQMLEQTLPKMISIETNLEPNLRMVMSDPTQVEQVLLNLATNAQDAMPEGGRLVMETKNVDMDELYGKTHYEIQPGSYVLLQISDNGLGMDEATRERIFEPFFTTKEIGSGTGLGLSTAFGIVKSHGGYIHCYSEIGQGTTFKIYLPTYLGDDTVAEDGPRLLKDLPRGSETILLVDDEEPLRNIGSDFLESKGYEVITAASGEDALEIYRDKDGQVDLVVLDLGMPGMGGRKCLKELLAINSAAKVLIASGYSADGQAMGVLAEGVAGFVPKPFSMADLALMVRETLDRK